MNNQTNLLFVYGSLRSGFQHAAYQYMSRYFTLLGEAKVKGKLYDLGNYPAAKASEGDEYIIGELYSINNADEFSYAIGQLDDYEGIFTEEGVTPEYRRELVTVFCNGQEYTAWMYWYNRDVTGLPVIDHGDVLLYLQQKNKAQA
ncbi:MAG: gamma-glutamylcyclotransferase [Bacteroidetes bacterium]|nr:gamma-glutamylcyclotransferase [Bacteroidota bacterium]